MTSNKLVKMGNDNIITAVGTLETSKIKVQIPTFPKPEIYTGYWTDENNNKINKALLGDCIKFHLCTRNISDDSLIDLNIYDHDYLSPNDLLIKYHQIKIVNNGGFAKIYLMRRLLSDIEDDNGNEIELLGECSYKNIKIELPISSADYLKVYDVGFVAYHDCRIEIRSTGEVHLCPHNFTTAMYNEWKANNNNPQNWNEGEIGISTQVGILKFKMAKTEQLIPINKDDTNPNANDSKIPIPNPYPSAHRSASRHQRRHPGNYPVAATTNTRVAGAGIILILDLIISGLELGLVWLQEYENSQIEKHSKQLIKVVDMVSEYYSQNEISATFNNYKSFCMVCNMVLCGYVAETDAAYQNNPELLRIAKNIYKSNTVNYDKI